MATLFSLPVPVALDYDGSPLMGASLTFTESGTSTPKAIYADAGLTTPLANPLTSDAFGAFTPVWLSTSAGNYTVALTDANGVQRWSVDDVGAGMPASELLALLLTVDGSGSTLDADTLDGYEASAFPRLAANNTYTGTATFSAPSTFSASATFDASIRAQRVELTYGTTVATDAALGNVFSLTVTDTVAFGISDPTNPVDGQRITYLIRNTSGGTMGTVTWGTAFKLATWASPATGYSRSIDFLYDGTNWVELARGAADIPN